MSPKVAVTGANGFLGRYVIRELRQRKVNVTPVFRSPPNDPTSDIGDQWITLDIHSPPENAFEQMGRPDVLVHLAWTGLPNYASLHHYETELPCQYNFLTSLLRDGLSCLVVTGSCLEYGLQCGPLHEGLTPQPTTPYGLAKDQLRRQLQFYQTAHSFDLVWARLFYMFGDGQANSSLWSQLKSAVSRGDDTFPMSLGEQLRDYLPAAVVARHLADLAVRRRDTGIINLCSGEPCSIRRLVEGWLRDNRWSIRLEFGRRPYPDYEPLAFWGDRTKLDSTLRSV